mmetsp:Transcript_17858/g.58707  ORF Transcript_17858/g.58707 Transcript_17858/m.58707 type:complete len:89 (-) Transcript_17858:38-304(-)
MRIAPMSLRNVLTFRLHMCREHTPLLRVGWVNLLFNPSKEGRHAVGVKAGGCRGAAGLSEASMVPGQRRQRRMRVYPGGQEESGGRNQ